MGGCDRRELAGVRRGRATKPGNHRCERAWVGGARLTEHERARRRRQERDVIGQQQRQDLAGGLHDVGLGAERT